MRHLPAATESELERALGEAVGSGAVTLIEVRTERAANRELHARLAAVGLAAL